MTNSGDRGRREAQAVTFDAPDLSPIETVFSKLKWSIKSVTQRTVVGLWSAFAQAANHVAEPSFKFQVEWSSVSFSRFKTCFTLARLTPIYQASEARLPNLPESRRDG